MHIDRLLQYQHASLSIPPVDTWQPELSGDIDILIKADGTWLYEGSPFARSAIPRVLATLLRRDSVGYCLVTPTERWRLQVEDLPLVAVEADIVDGAWWFTTQFDDVIRLDDQHPMTLSRMPNGELMPEIAVRFGLSARLHRNVYYRLADQAAAHVADSGEIQLTLFSAGQAYLFGTLANEAETNDVPSEAP